MSTEPTGSLTFEDLIVEVALALGVAYYGTNGDEEPQIPQNTHDLAECKRYVNNGIRMFISNAPSNGWRWLRPIAEVVLWPDVVVDDDVTVTGLYDPASDVTVVTASAAAFYPSMEEKSIVVTGEDTYTIASYVSATIVHIAGNNSWSGSATFAIASDGNFTLPRGFSGQYTGPIEYAAGSNLGVTINWASEAQIRRYRSPSTVETGNPFYASIRPSTVARRWVLMLYPTPSEVQTVEFPYDLHFDKLVAMADLQPAGHALDEAVKAACLASADRGTGDDTGAMTYYRASALPDAYAIDSRSAPRRLGYVGNGPPEMSLDDYRRFAERPTVIYNQ